MSKLQKLYHKIKNNPKQVRFEELDRLLARAGFTRRQPRGGSSHYIYERGETKNHHPLSPAAYLTGVYVEFALEALEQEFERGDEGE